MFALPGAGLGDPDQDGSALLSRADASRRRGQISLAGRVQAAPVAQTAVRWLTFRGGCVDEGTGWRRDPFNLHEWRYFVEDKPTSQVGDAGLLSTEDPPQVPNASVVTPGGPKGEPPSVYGFLVSGLKTVGALPPDYTATQARIAQRGRFKGWWGRAEAFLGLAAAGCAIAGFSHLVAGWIMIPMACLGFGFVLLAKKNLRDRLRAQGRG